MNAPVPTGDSKNAFSDLPPKFAGMIELANTDRSDRNGAHGSLSLNTTVWSPWALIDLIAKSRNDSGPSELEAARLIENTTSSATSGLPSENFTFGRRWKVQVRWSELAVYPCASHGASEPLGWVRYSGSKIWLSV